MFYAISAFILSLFVLVPLAVELSVDADFPVTAFFQEWIESGDQFARNKN